ncbi:hypothetical protein ACQY0O_005743 [Thecaphora frezii]
MEDGVALPVKHLADLLLSLSLPPNLTPVSLLRSSQICSKMLVQSVASFVLLALSTAPMGALTATLTFDCTKVPNICSNDCYAIRCFGKPSTLHRDAPNASARRQQAAC